MKFLITLAILCHTLPAEASYRVFRMKVIYFDIAGKILDEQTVLSTLDPAQYEHYHSGFRNSKVELVDHWYCPGDTSRRKYCDAPPGHARVRDRNPASARAKRKPLKKSRYLVMH